MIKFYEFSSTDTLIVLDTEKQLAAMFPLGDVKEMSSDLKIWWGDNDITNYIIRNFECTLDALKALHA